MSRRSVLYGAGVAGFALAIAGCGGGSDSGSGSSATTAAGGTQAAVPRPNESKGSITIAQVTLDIQPGDPQKSTGGTQEPYRVGQATGLFFRDQLDGTIKPGIAESITPAADGRSYTIKVRSGITFTNDDPLSAEDVKFSIERYMAVGGSKGVYTAVVDRVESPDPTTVVVQMKQVAPAFYYSLYGLDIVPKKYIEGLGDGPFAEKAFAEKPVAAGPYRLTENKIGSHIFFVAYDKYFLGTPHVKQIRVNVVPELTTRIAQLQTGEVDIVQGILPDQIDTIKAIPGAQVVSSKGAGASELTFFDMMKPGSPFADVRVRQALNHAVNRKQIADTLYRGEATVLTALTVRSTATIGYDEALAKEEPFPYDPQKAKQLLAAAGLPNGFDTSIVTYDTSTTPGTPAMMQAVSESLRQIGVRAPVQMMETGQYVAKFRDKSLTGMGPISFGGFTSDFATQYATHYMKGAPFSYDDWAEGDDMWRQIQGEIDAEKRKKLSQDLVRKLSRERIPNIALVATNAITALGPKVAAYPRPDAEPYLTGLHNVRLK